VSNLNSFFARHAKAFLLEFAIAVPVVFAVFALTILVAVSVEQGVEPQPPQRYTVHFDGIDYQDLTRDYHGLSRSRAAYKTKAGKRIEFRGSFYEVEQ
jgi:hypothetical protein